MSDNKTAQEFSIHSIYLKDVSFESPNAPAIFQEKVQPQIQLNLGVNTNPLDQDVFEVVLSLTVTAKLGERTAFLVELQQAGIFRLRGFEDEHLKPMLGIYCPNVLFPYAREAISSLVSKGGFPPLMLEPVNFDAIYAQHMEQQQPEKVQ